HAAPKELCFRTGDHRLHVGGTSISPYTPHQKNSASEQETTDFMSVVLQFHPTRRTKRTLLPNRRPPTSCRWYFNFTLHAAPKELCFRTGDHRLHVGGTSISPYTPHQKYSASEQETTDFMSVVLQFHPTRRTKSTLLPNRRPPTSCRWYFNFTLHAAPKVLCFRT